MKNTQVKIIIDTDPGHDDALAIMFLARSKKINIQALTTVAGNSNIQNVTNNARFIIDLLERDIPIYSGSKGPIKRKLITANVHGQNGLAGASVVNVEKLNNQAVDKIIEIVRRFPKQISIVVLGPETNIAKAFLKDPKLPKLIDKLIIMGGAIEVPGNKNKVAEFNIFVDPEAAKMIFDAPVEKVLIPLDVCNEIPLFLSDFKKIKGKLSSPIMSMMKHFIKGIEKFEKTKGALVYDALAAYYLINPKAFELKKMDVRVETKGELTSGMTVADRRKWGEKAPNVKVVTKIDRDMFVDDFISLISDN